MKMDESLAAFQALILQMYRKVKTMHELALDILRSGDKGKSAAVDLHGRLCQPS